MTMPGSRCLKNAPRLSLMACTRLALVLSSSGNLAHLFSKCSQDKPLVNPLCGGWPTQRDFSLCVGLALRREARTAFARFFRFSASTIACVGTLKRAFTPSSKFSLGFTPSVHSGFFIKPTLGYGAKSLVAIGVPITY